MNLGKQVLNGVLAPMDLALVNRRFHKANLSRLNRLQCEKDGLPSFVPLWQRLNQKEREFVAPFLPFSQSQIAQDIFVLSEMASRELPPFFVEFGATDGLELNNTYLLEKRLGWSGILAEPARIWQERLSLNRGCQIDHRCVAEQGNREVEFLEVGNGETSSMSDFAYNDRWAQVRQGNRQAYGVPTVTLEQLLIDHRAPASMGYLSIDTEGSEWSILRGFDFGRYRFAVITVEHNHEPETRANLFNLLTAHGYQRKYEEISGFDDWYVLP
jgi:FkbM family methyltransferase